MKLIKMLCLTLVLVMSFAVCAQAETLIVGTNPEFSPFEYVGDDGVITGIDIDIVKAIAGKLGYDVKVEAIDWNGLIPALTSGKVDLLIAGMTITEERKQSVLFTDPYYNATQAIIVMAEGSPVAAEADMHGKKIAVIMGYTGDLYISENFTDSEIVRYDKSMDAVQDLVNGRVDAVVLDEAPAKVYERQGIGVTVLPDRLSNEEYGIAFKKEDTELVAKFNEALAQIMSDGTLDNIVSQYY